MAMLASVPLSEARRREGRRRDALLEHDAGMIDRGAYDAVMARGDIAPRAGGPIGFVDYARAAKRDGRRSGQAADPAAGRVNGRCTTCSG